MKEMSEQPENVLRRIGGVLVVIGLVFFYFLMQVNTNWVKKEINLAYFMVNKSEKFW